MVAFKRWLAVAVVLVMTIGTGIPQIGSVWAADEEGSAVQPAAATKTNINESDKGAATNTEEPVNNPAGSSKGASVKVDDGQMEGADVQPESLAEDPPNLKSINPEEEQTQISVIFKSGDSIFDEQMVIIKNDVITADLQLPGTPEGEENQKFIGWFDENNNKLVEPSENLSGFLAAVGADCEITYTARYSELYYAYFMSSDSANAEVVHTETTDQKDGEISMYRDYHPDNARVSQWKDKDSDKLYELDQTARISSDTVFVPVIVDCCWLTFNTQGGGNIDSIYVEKGTACDLTQITAPKKKGYSFTGWSTSADGEVIGNSITPESDTILYAQWKPAQTNYTVVYWGENADDNDYSALASEKKQAVSGTEISLREDTVSLPASVSDREHFKFRSADNKTVAADGSTVINVYYSRNVYELKFTEWTSPFTKKTFLTVKAKYDSDIASVWRNDPVKSRLDDGMVFRTSLLSDHYLFMQKMPGENLTLTAEKWVGVEYSWGYYLEVLDNNPPAGATVVTDGDKSYYLYQTIKVKGLLTELTYEEDYFPITGFKQKYDKVPKFENRKAKLFYDRQSYNLKLVNYGDEKSESILFEASIADKGSAPSCPDAMPENAEFMGWYQVPPEQITEDTRPYDFSDRTMPAKNLVLYSYWKAQPLTVSLNVELDAQQIKKTFKVNPGDSIADAPEYKALVKEIEDAGKVLKRWIDQDTDNAYDINKPLSKSVVLDAVLAGEKYTVSYDIVTNGGSGTVLVDNNSYASGSKAKVKKFTGTAPEGSKFKKWKCSDGGEYYPGDEVNVTKDLKLTAVYAPVSEKIDLTYYANYKVNGVEASKTVKVFDGQNVTVEGSDFGAPRGNRFDGWTTRSDGGGDAYPVGSRMHVTKDGTNSLYAKYSLNQYDYKLLQIFEGEGTLEKTGTADYGTNIVLASGVYVTKSVKYRGKNYYLEETVNFAGKITDNAEDNVVLLKYALDEDGNDIPDRCEVAITYEVENGTWNDGSTDPIVRKVALKKDGKYSEEGSYTIQKSDLPDVGDKAYKGYKAGSWDPNPVGVVIKKNMYGGVVMISSSEAPQGISFKYSYAKDNIHQDDPVNDGDDDRNVDRDNLDNSVRTGDEMPLTGMAAVMLLATLAGALLIRRRKEERQ